ncbi:glycosyltransferase family 1 protein [Nisaea acidiphila]|uniref:Glycosyltransferase family 1 protein n=1 Tax=Nisaea acidiphila TaxID=1862145 RepID=A0A9J7AL86_9PROT|nr:glycosyltransferase family 1 protein [Nisaea acidiphila]UUX48240.1 glycosyltransferase family 1 protein [Nisaea acidiphila]
MKILLVSDAWFPQVNGVVRTLNTVIGELREMGHEVETITPDQFKTVPCPTYPEIRLACWPFFRVPAMIEAARPDAIHIATEGPLGMTARRYCVRNKLPFTTAYHTRFPEYVQPRLGVPVAWTYKVMRHFHGKSAGVMVATKSIRADLEARGFDNIKDWSRGVDTELFRPQAKDAIDAKRPVFMFVGRVAVEKNLPAFLELDLPGSKVVVGDGPDMDMLKKKFPETIFVGAKKGEELARHYAAADVFVFPSRTDTFGLVMLEALASGVPVAAFPVPGPLDVIASDKVGVLSEDLRDAALKALELKPEDCRAYALGFSWRACAEQFFGNLAPFDSDAAFGRFDTRGSRAA